MKVFRSLSSGYCLGVEKTIKNAEEALRIAKNKNLNAYCIGELIHNPDIVKYFEEKGLRVIKDSNVEPGVVLVRAHGVPKATKEDFESKGFYVIDSTCQKIIATKKQISTAIEKGRKILVVGTKDHAEVKTLIGVDSTSKFFVASADELVNVFGKLNSEEKISVAVQSTFSETEFETIKSLLNSRFNDIEYLNKLCSVCSARKKEASKLADVCDAIIVVGGKTSSNTKELAEHVSITGKPVYKIENCGDFNSEFDKELRKYKSIGICSGTSTPSSVLDAVSDYLESL